MKFNLRKMYSAVGVCAFVLVAVFAFSANQAHAATCTAIAGDWNTTGTWVTDCGHIPTSADDVIIPTAVTVTLNSAGMVANTLSIAAAGTANGLAITSPGTLTVSGATTIAAASAAVNSTLAVGNGAFTTHGITITGSGTATRNSILSVSTGTITSDNGISFVGTPGQAQLTATGAGNIVLTGTGTIGTGGTVTLNAASTVKFNGTAQTINVYSYGNLTTGGSGTKTVGSALTIAGNLTIGNGTQLNLTGSSTANALYLGNVQTYADSYGLTGSTATYKDATYFVTGTGKVTAATGVSIGGGGAANDFTYQSSTGPQSGSSSSTTSSSSSTTYQSSSGSSSSTTTSSTTDQTTTTLPTLIITAVPPVVTPLPITVIDGCTGTTGYSAVNGMSCATNGSNPAMSGSTSGSTMTGTAMTYDFGTVTLKNGSKGAAVMELQKFLNAKLMLGLTVDGKLGPKTIAVIKTWQKAHGLVADGLIGAKTKAAMNADAMVMVQ